jgi:Leucine-rich repeat (LRR) protein
MRRASFCDNEISRLEGLEDCAALEELSLEENRVVVIEGLQRLTMLKKLDLGKNRIARIENLAPFLGEAVQVEPMKSELTAPGTNLLTSAGRTDETRVESAWNYE